MFDSSEVLRNEKEIVEFLERAYQCGLPLLIAQSYSDLLSQAGGFTFHYGTPDPQMRRIASWVLTNYELPKEIITALWKRHGREDLKLAGLLLANTSIEALGTSQWEFLFSMIGKAESVESLLEVIEEFKRAEVAKPSIEKLQNEAANSNLSYQLVILILEVYKIRGVTEEFIENAPEGGDLFERIRSRLLQQRY